MASTYPTSLDTFTNPTATSLLTSPSHAQQHSDINDAMEAVQTKLAIGNTVIGAWINYTPTWTASTTNPVIGNGTIEGRYALVNGFVVGGAKFSYICFGVRVVVKNFSLFVVMMRATCYNNQRERYLIMRERDSLLYVDVSSNSVTSLWRS